MLGGDIKLTVPRQRRGLPSPRAVLSTGESWTGGARHASVLM